VLPSHLIIVALFVFRGDVYYDNSQASDCSGPKIVT